MLSARAIHQTPVVALLALAGLARAEDVVPFRLTGIESQVTVNYMADGQTFEQPDIGRTRSAQSGWRSELFVMTHSYVYHPNLLTLDIGGGPVLQGGSFADERFDTQAHSLLYNLSVRANLLRGKPYNATVFYSHLNPSVSVAPGEVMIQNNTSYGVDASLLAPFTPVPMQFGLTRSSTQGRSSERVVDEHSDQFNVSANRSLGSLGSTQVQYQSTQRASRSGSAGLAVQSSTADTQSLNVDTRLQFGAAREFEVSNLFSMNRQNYTLDTGAVPALSELRFMLDGRLRRADGSTGFATYSYAHTGQGAQDSTNQDIAANASWRLSHDSEAGLGARGSETRTTQFKARGWGVDANLRHEEKLGPGTLQTSYAARFDDRSQLAASAQADVLGERVSLAGSQFVSLLYPYVVAGSIVVSNAARSQVFVQGIDYQLLQVGGETRVQRLIGGHILDGEPLLVDYAYQVGGTYTYRRLDQTVNLSWNVARYGSVYYRYYGSGQHLVTGQPSFALTSVTSNVLGARADLPVNPGLAVSLSASLEHESRRETLLAYQRTSLDLAAQTDEPLMDLGYFRASGRRARIDYHNPVQDSDLRMYDLRYWYRNALGMDITAAWSHERDTAGVLPRQRTDESVSMVWQKRKFTLSGNLVHTTEVQGSIGRRRTSLQLQAKRDL